jgi:hypothetical protein
VQLRRIGLVIDLIRHVRDQRPLGAEVVRRLAGLIDGHVSRMRIRTQAVEDGEVGMLTELQGLLRHRAAVGIIGELHAGRRLFEDEAERGFVAMRQKSRTDDAAARQHQFRGHEIKRQRDVARSLRLTDRIREDGLDALEADLGRIHRDGRPALVRAELTKVIHSKHVVGVAVGQDERVDLSDIVLQALRPELRRSVDLNVVPLDDDVNARPGSPVARVLQSRPGLSWAGNGQPCDVPQPMMRISIPSKRGLIAPKAKVV